MKTYIKKKHTIIVMIIGQVSFERCPREQSASIPQTRRTMRGIVTATAPPPETHPSWLRLCVYGRGLRRQKHGQPAPFRSSPACRPALRLGVVSGGVSRVRDVTHPSRFECIQRCRSNATPTLAARSPGQDRTVLRSRPRRAHAPRSPSRIP